MSHSDFNQTGKSDQELLLNAKRMDIVADGVVIGYAWQGGRTTHTYRIGGANCESHSMGQCLKRLAELLSQ
jgi:hypothetical protein